LTPSLLLFVMHMTGEGPDSTFTPCSLFPRVDMWHEIERITLWPVTGWGSSNVSHAGNWVNVLIHLSLAKTRYRKTLPQKSWYGWWQMNNIFPIMAAAQATEVGCREHFLELFGNNTLSYPSQTGCWRKDGWGKKLLTHFLEACWGSHVTSCTPTVYLCIYDQCKINQLSCHLRLLLLTHQRIVQKLLGW